jgi:hypothetical protein
MTKRSASALNDAEVRALTPQLAVTKRAAVVGSFRYQTFEYPSDIDLMDFFPHRVHCEHVARSVIGIMRGTDGASSLYLRVLDT